MLSKYKDSFSVGRTTAPGIIARVQFGIVCFWLWIFQVYVLKFGGFLNTELDLYICTIS